MIVSHFFGSVVNFCFFEKRRWFDLNRTIYPGNYVIPSVFVYEHIYSHLSNRNCCKEYPHFSMQLKQVKTRMQSFFLVFTLMH